MNSKISYSELDIASRKLALYLYGKCGISLGKNVGICAPRSGQMIIMMLAVMRSGGAYVAMEPK
jgi:acyl-CoA synthetase (AMP-forming)/AMP-acid ligase II